MCVKNSTEEWVDEDIFEGIRIRDKKFKNDGANYRKARNQLQKPVREKKSNYVKTKLRENIGNSKELWKSLKSLGLPSKNVSQPKICLGKEGNVTFDSKVNAESFKGFFENLSTSLVKKLPIPTNTFGINIVKEYYKHLNLENKHFTFQPTTK